MLSAAEKKSAQVYRWLLAYIDENKFSGNQRLPSEIGAAPFDFVHDSFIHQSVNGNSNRFPADAQLSAECIFRGCAQRSDTGTGGSARISDR